MELSAPAPGGPPPPPVLERAPVLRGRGLRRRFGRVRAVDGLDLEVREGEVYGFLGVNGAGKTTAIRMFMGILRADGGELELFGLRTRRTTRRQKAQIGYVSQEQVFYPWMTPDQLGRFVGGLYPTWDRAEYERLLAVFQVPRDRKVAQLSGGTKAKLALALALAPQPRLLILDEPTAGLDPVARREFLDLVEEQARGQRRTTFFSSHLVDEVERVATRVGIIHDGRMRYEGGLEALRREVRAIRWPLAEGERPVLPSWVAASGAAHPLRLEQRDGSARLTLRATPAFWSDLCLEPLPDPPPVSAASGVEPGPTASLSPLLRGEGELTPVGAGERVPHGVVENLSLEDIFIAMVGVSPIPL